MYTGSTDWAQAFRISMELPSRAISSMNQAVELVSDGDIVDAAILVNQAKVQARSGVAVARAANEMMGSLLDILA
jgi:hypothetical protein